MGWIAVDIMQIGVPLRRSRAAGDTGSPLPTGGHTIPAGTVSAADNISLSQTVTSRARRAAAPVNVALL